MIAANIKHVCGYINLHIIIACRSKKGSQNLCVFVKFYEYKWAFIIRGDSSSLQLQHGTLLIHCFQFRVSWTRKVKQHYAIIRIYIYFETTNMYKIVSTLMSRNMNCVTHLTDLVSTVYHYFELVIVVGDL